MDTLKPDWYLLNCVYPISHYRLSTNKRALQIKRKTLIKARPPIDSRPGKITQLSKKSLRKLALVATAAAELLKSMLTLTYSAIVTDGAQVKKDLNYILNWLRRRYSGLQYLWFLEFQQRGAPHFHILMSVNVSRETLFELSRVWARRQGLKGKDWYNAYKVTNNKKSWENLRESDGAARYAAKYAKKQEQKEVPKEYQNVGRFWGTSYSLSAGLFENWVSTDESEIKAMLHDIRPEIENWEFYPGFIWLTKV